jgi:hypothetical protein
MMSLTDKQMTQVQQAAALLAPYDRDHFVRSAANFLRDRRPSNETRWGEDEAQRQAHPRVARYGAPLHWLSRPPRTCGS